MCEWSILVLASERLEKVKNSRILLCCRCLLGMRWCSIALGVGVRMRGGGVLRVGTTLQSSLATAGLFSKTFYKIFPGVMVFAYMQIKGRVCI